MSRRITYHDICNRMAAARCYNDGQSVQHIARSAGKSTTTVYKWLRDAWHLVQYGRRHKHQTRKDDQ
jgi:transposase-like protein